LGAVSAKQAGRLSSRNGRSLSRTGDSDPVPTVSRDGVRERKFKEEE
jgi:hypothetical protein